MMLNVRGLQHLKTRDNKMLTVMFFVNYHGFAWDHLN